MSDKIDIEALKEYLPFYVNGTIKPDDKMAVEEGLAVSPDLRAALEEERKLQAKFNRSMEAELEAVSSTAQAGETAEVYQMQAAVPQPEQAGEPSALSQALGFLNPKNWSPAVTFALAAAAVGQTAVLASQSGTISDQRAQIAALEDENFRLASGQKDCDDEASIILELRENVRWSDAAALIDGEGLSIVSGTGQGVLMLGYEGEEAELEAVLERLNASELVLDASKAA